MKGSSLIDRRSHKIKWAKLNVKVICRPITNLHYSHVAISACIKSQIDFCCLPFFHSMIQQGERWKKILSWHLPSVNCPFSQRTNRFDTNKACESNKGGKEVVKAKKGEETKQIIRNYKSSSAPIGARAALSVPRRFESISLLISSVFAPNVNNFFFRLPTFPFQWIKIIYVRALAASVHRKLNFSCFM